jgi:hypothetical protein
MPSQHSQRPPPLAALLLAAHAVVTASSIPAFAPASPVPLRFSTASINSFNTPSSSVRERGFSAQGTICSRLLGTQVWSSGYLCAPALALPLHVLDVRQNSLSTIRKSVCDESS